MHIIITVVLSSENGLRITATAVRPFVPQLCTSPLQPWRRCCPCLLLCIRRGSIHTGRPRLHAHGRIARSAAHAEPWPWRSAGRARGCQSACT